MEDKRKLVEAIDSGQMPLFYGDTQPLQSPIKTSGEGQDLTDFEPCMFFFYGTLMDPEVLQSVAALEDLPELQDAWLEGFELKMWNRRYPTLLPKENIKGRIKGKAWKVTSIEQCLRLQHYETSAYECCDCVVRTDDQQLIKALTFKWARDPSSAELSDGMFDLAYWQKNHKPPTF